MTFINLGILILGFLIPISELYFTLPARILMNHYPAIYNPSFPIFSLRASHNWNPTEYPIYYSCNKAVVETDNAAQIKELTEKCGDNLQKGYCNDNYCYYNLVN